MHITTKIIIVENVFLFFLFPFIFWISGYTPPLSYEWHKLLHIIGAVFFLGNIIVTGVWMYLASKTNDIHIIHFAAKVTNWMDVFFTGPGVILVFSNGLWLATNWGVAPFGFFSVHWLLVGLTLFILSGFIWFYLIYLQDRLIYVTSQDINPHNFKSILKHWFIWGIIAILLPSLSIAMMVLKPSL